MASSGLSAEVLEERLQESRISEVIVTNTLPIPEEHQFEKLTVLSIAPILAKAITEVFTDGSVTSMFEGDSMEAEAWAYLTVRSRKGLPITFPGTTGAPHPLSGGLVAKP